MDNPTLAPHKAPAARILVVDDHPNTATTLARAISQLGDGVEVMSATSGKEAMEYANGGAFDVLITDMMMPGINGLELIERLQSHPGGRPAHNILITAYDVPGLKESARRLKVNEVIIKPVRPEHIYQIVSNILGGMGQTKTATQSIEVHQPFKILIADDVPDNITLLSRYMQSEGYSYITASNGVEALEKTRAEMPDLILLDVNMPQKDGFAVLEEMRGDAEIQHIPVIILTAARTNVGDVQSGLNLGADDYVTKPFDKRELFARIRTKLRVKEAEDAIRRRNRQLSVLPEIAKELSARLGVGELLGVALRRAVETLGALVGYGIIFQSTEPLLKTHHSSTSSPEEIAAPTWESLLKEIEGTPQGKIIEDARAHPAWEGIQDGPVRSALVMPLAGREKLLGMVILGHEQSRYFKLEHLILLQAIACQTTIAVENAQLYEQIAREQQDLNKVLYDAAEGVLVFDSQVRLLSYSPSAENFFDNLQDRLSQAFSPNDYETFFQLLKEAQLKSASVPIISKIILPDKRALSVSITHLQNGGYVAVLRDISSFIQLQ